MRETPDVVVPEANEAESHGGHDLNWPIPMWTIVPLVGALVALMVYAFGSSLTLVSLLPQSYPKPLHLLPCCPSCSH